MIFAEMWRKKMDAMKDSERTRTMNGSLLVCHAQGCRDMTTSAFMALW